jgi:hypothetical protein
MDMRKRSCAVLMIMASGACAGMLWVSLDLGDLVHRPFRLWADAPAIVLFDARADEQEDVVIRSTFAIRPSGFWSSATAARSNLPILGRAGAPLASMPPVALTQPSYSLSAPVFLSDPAATQARAIAVGDVSGDGLDDLVFLSLRYAPNMADSRMEIYAAYQRSDGQLDAAVKIAESGVNLAYQLLIADLDADSVGDIITDTANGVMVLRSNADGTFTSSAVVVGDPYNLVVSDVDRDGHLDILVDTSNTSATVVHGDGLGGIAGTSTLPLPSSAVRTTGDVTGDGLDDLILATIFNSPLQEFRIYPALASGGYAAPMMLSRPMDANQTAALAVGDFNADGRNDLILDEAKDIASLQLYLRDSQGNFPSSNAISRERGASSGSLIATDLNRDGRTDLAIAHSGWGYIGYYLQTDAGFATETVVNAYQFLGRHNYFVTGDLNHDGCGDLVISRWTQSPVLLYGQGCAPPRVAACCSRPIAVEGSSTPGVAGLAPPLVRPSSSVDAHAGIGLVPVAGPRLERNQRGMQGLSRKQTHIPVLDP